MPPAPHGNQAPDGLDDTEWPGSLEKAIARRGQASHSKRKHVARGASLERIEHKHRRDRDRAEERQWIHQ